MGADYRRFERGCALGEVGAWLGLPVASFARHPRTSHELTKTHPTAPSPAAASIDVVLHRPRRLLMRVFGRAWGRDAIAGAVKGEQR